ncbi:hypothetical protein HUT16_35250 [Kitasatospora sp. NA04385]|uniref:hypothetical protein n=1 Tax=Kitasatospora sp. NA04385 TaxID=2742135 RepID=UPI001591B0B6|nr:hypothetical protein [Kitasatospora sp. NA04385]QKW23660.1 hypothetical protein HUT16_35250 [Kitasatospora sp. NA04385]
MSMSAAVEQVVLEAQRQLVQGEWDPARADLVLVRETALALAAAVGPADVQAKSARIDRLAGLREALAVLAVTVARTHGRLAWFLAQCSSELAPVLHWRALEAPEGGSFGAVLPDEEEFADAEEAIRSLTAMLARTGPGRTA